MTDRFQQIQARLLTLDYDSEDVKWLAARVRELEDALLVAVNAIERTENNLSRAVAGKAIRDLAETYGECKHAIELLRAALAPTQRDP